MEFHTFRLPNKWTKQAKALDVDIFLIWTHSNIFFILLSLILFYEKMKLVLFVHNSEVHRHPWVNILF